MVAEVVKGQEQSEKIRITTISTAPISSKIIEFSGTPSTGVGQSHSQQMIGCSGNLEGISRSERVSFQMVMEINYAI